MGKQPTKEEIVKKTIAGILLATALTMGMTATAFATSDNVAASEKSTATLEWNYEKTSGGASSTYPAELVTFTVTADEGNPANTHVSIDSLNMVDAVSDTITVHLPSYSVVGTYNYTVTTSSLSSFQGVTRTPGPITFKIRVQAVYNDDHTAIVPDVAFFDSTGQSKITEFTTLYDHGTLTVGKQVEGNLGSRSDEFEVQVSFQASGGLKVKNDIVYYLPGDPEAKTIVGDDISNITPTVVTITLSHGESVTFSNIPAGITYAVAETAPDGYTVTISEHDGTISADDADEVTVTNTKNASVNTGVILDNMPIVAAAVVAIAGVVALLALKRRRANR